MRKFVYAFVVLMLIVSCDDGSKLNIKSCDEYNEGLSLAYKNGLNFQTPLDVVAYVYRDFFRAQDVNIHIKMLNSGEVLRQVRVDLEIEGEFDDSSKGINKILYLEKTGSRWYFVSQFGDSKAH